MRKTTKLIKKIKENLNKLRDISCVWIRFNIIKISVLPNLIYRCNAIPVSNFMDSNKLILEFIERRKSPRIINTILKKKKQVERPSLSDFKTY